MRLSVITLLVGLHQTALSLSTLSNSPCAGICSSDTYTELANLTCVDTEYGTKTRGMVMKACLECLQNSTALSAESSPPRDNDGYYFFYNIQYTIKYCLGLYDGTPSRPSPNLELCDDDCEPLRPVYEQNWSNLTAVGPYHYCTANDSAFEHNVKKCASCHQTQEGSVVVGNFLNLMETACEKQPDKASGELVQFDRGLFDLSVIDQTDASATATPSPTSTSTEDPSSSSSGLSPAVSGGIGAAAGIGGVAILAAVFFLLRRHRRRHLAATGAVSLPYSNKAAQDSSSSGGTMPVSALGLHEKGYRPVAQEMDAGQQHVSELSAEHEAGSIGQQRNVPDR